jgi:hypothetical protein
MQTARQSNPIRAEKMGLLAWICLNCKLECHGSRIQIKYASRACFWTCGGSEASSFRNRLVVWEVTLDVQRQCVTGLKLTQCLIRQLCELILTG